MFERAHGGLNCTAEIGFLLFESQIPFPALRPQKFLVGESPVEMGATVFDTPRSALLVQMPWAVPTDGGIEVNNVLGGGAWFHDTSLTLGADDLGRLAFFIGLESQVAQVELVRVGCGAPNGGLVEFDLPITEYLISRWAAIGAVGDERLQRHAFLQMRHGFDHQICVFHVVGSYLDLGDELNRVGRSARLASVGHVALIGLVSFLAISGLQIIQGLQAARAQLLWLFGLDRFTRHHLVVFVEETVYYLVPEFHVNIK